MPSGPGADSLQELSALANSSSKISFSKSCLLFSFNFGQCLKKSLSVLLSLPLLTFFIQQRIKVSNTFHYIRLAQKLNPTIANFTDRFLFTSHFHQTQKILV
jgi:hypothetical protein